MSYRRGYQDMETKAHSRAVRQISPPFGETCCWPAGCSAPRGLRTAPGAEMPQVCESVEAVGATCFEQRVRDASVQVTPFVLLSPRG